MPPTEIDWLSIFLFVVFGLVLLGFGFVTVIEAWRRWSDNRNQKAFTPVAAVEFFLLAGSSAGPIAARSEVVPDPS
jgi:hypothetical protein